MKALSEFLFSLAAACLLVIELGLGALGVLLAAEFIRAMWERSAIQGTLAFLLFVGVAFALVRSWRRERLAASDDGVHPGPSMSRIPISGSMGAVYMLQSVIWVLVAPEVGLFYGALIGGGLLLLPVAYYVNRASRRQASHVAVGGLIGVLTGLLVASAVSSRQVPAAGLFGLAVLAGVVGGAFLIVRRRRQTHPSIVASMK